MINKTFLRKEKNSHRTNVGCKAAHQIYSALSRQGSDPIKLAYNPYVPDGGQINSQWH